MNREDILSMGQQAGWEMPQTWDESDGFLQRLERFAGIAAAAEREQCAKVADYCQSALFDSMHDLDCATAIRARGAK